MLSVWLVCILKKKRLTRGDIFTVKLGFLAEAYHLEPSKFQLYVQNNAGDFCTT